MSPTPLVQPLPYKHRSWFFRFLVLIFVISVPIFIFYSAGYRINIFDNDRSIVTVGGMFISAETANTQIFINELLVEDYRIFQRAAYISSLPAGIHRLHVQGEGLHTWVKELPVYSHIVTEASSFNLPVTPQLRLITPYTNVAGTAVFIGGTSTLPASGTVAYRNVFIATTSRATSTLSVNAEYKYLSERFASSTAAKTPTVIERITTEIEQFSFPNPSATTTVATTSEVATTTKTNRDRTLYELDGKVYVTWTGSDNNIPYYYCMPYIDATTTQAVYGPHVQKAMAATYSALEVPLKDGERTCRDTIEITLGNNTLYSFDFFPSNNDLIIVHHSGGIYVIETDDRAWQNAQQIYPAGEYNFLIDGSRLYIQDGDSIFELLTTLEQ